MSLYQCSECNQEISTKARQCPHCGAPVDTSSQKHPVRVKRRHLFFGGFLTIAAMLVVVYFLYWHYGFGKEQIDGMIHWGRDQYLAHR